MKPYSEVFERVEKKYLVTREERFSIESVLARYMQPDSYGCSRITSLYLDTEYDEVVARSLEKPLYKEKIRLRAYGEDGGNALVDAFSAGQRTACECSGGRGFPHFPDAYSAHFDSPSVDGGGIGASTHRFREPVFCELKKKYAGVVYKRRVCFSLGAAVDYLIGRDYGESCRAHPLSDAQLQCDALCPLSMQISREIDAARARYDRLFPRMAIDYLRTAWVPRLRYREELGDLRITFDGRPRCRSLCLEGAEWIPFVGRGESIMEVKSSAAFPLWLVHAFSESGVYSRSFTKYGTAHLLAVGVPALDKTGFRMVSSTS